MKKIIAIVLTLLLIFTTLVGCNVGQNEVEIVKVNEVTHSIFYSPFYLAIELGYFREENIEIELTNGGGSNVSMTAVISGQADIGLVGPEMVIYVYNEGKVDYPKVFAQLTKRDGSFLVSKNNEKNFSYKDLTGKEVLAGRKGGLPAMTLEYVLNKNGLFNGKNITLNYDVAFNMMAGAFESGTGDYTTLFEPTASDFVKAKKGFIVTSIGKDSGEVPYTCFVASTSFIENKPKIIEGFVRALYKAKKYMNENDSMTVASSLQGQFTGTEITQIAAAVESYHAIDAWCSDFAMTEDSFIRLQDIMQNAEQLSKRAEYTKLIFNDIANKVKAELDSK